MYYGGAIPALSGSMTHQNSQQSTQLNNFTNVVIGQHALLDLAGQVE